MQFLESSDEIISQLPRVQFVRSLDEIASQLPGQHWKNEKLSNLGFSPFLEPTLGICCFLNLSGNAF